MADVRIAPYGAWASPIAARELAAATIGVDQVTTSAGRLTWLENRPSEGGRQVLVERGADGRPVELTSAAFNVRTRVHEYGGLSYARAGETIVFSNFGDQRLYVQHGAAAPVALTPPGYRYADFAMTPAGDAVVAVREDHTSPGAPRNAIVRVPLAGGTGSVLFAGSDFVAYPRLSADGRRLAFVAWNHPDMPWDATTLHVGRLAGETLADLATLAGGPGESVIEPQWHRDGTLYFLSDRSDTWNLHRWRDGLVEAVTSLDLDAGGALWALGTSTYGLVGGHRALVRVSRAADDAFVVVDLATGRATPLTLPFVSLGAVAVIDDRTAACVAGPVDGPPELIAVDLDAGTHTTLHRPVSLSLPPALVSVGEPIEFATARGADGAPRTAHAFFYPPSNPGFRGPPDSLPPLIVQMHGGPTSHSRRNFAIARQFWTSRGFAVVDVNYGGSTGFGRRYRERLRHQWGIVDVADAVAAVEALAAGGRIDGRRVAIRGSSAGGFTTLAALAFTRRFAAGANYFGVADVEALARDTHKFESRYLDGLIAPLPEGRDDYRARSPLFHLDAFACPLITFQGVEDLVVPVAQSRAIVAALDARGVPVAYLEFEGEQHGFRQAATIIRACEAELYFYGRVFGFEPADRIEPVVIRNFDAR